MSADKNHRVSSFDNVSPGKAPDRPSFPSPPEAQAMVDQALRMLGADPKEVTDPDGWRLLGFGTAHARINVVEWQPGVHFLAVGSPILRWPGDRRLRARMAEVLLRLDHSQTGMARFSIDGPLVLLSYVRPIHGLDLDEVLAAIRAVLRVADALDERMQEQYQVAMPQIDMDDSTWQGVLIVLRLCDDHTQDVFRHLMEGWVERKGIVDTGKGNIGLRSRAGSKTLAALVPYAAAGPLVTVGWDSLARIRGVLSKDVAAFKQAVPRPDRFETTKSSAHLPIDESFTPAMVDQLLDALLLLEKALQRAVPPKPAALPDLEESWGLTIKAGGATQRNIESVLMACPPEARQAYIELLQGWHDAGQKLYTNNPRRAYLRLSVGQHTFALCTLCAPRKNRGAAIEFYYPLSMYFDEHVEARRRYEQAVARMPGFMVHNSGARIPVGEGFGQEEAVRLLKVLQRLAEDMGAKA